MSEEPVNVSGRSKVGSSWVNIVLGIWVVISPFVLVIHSTKALWSNILTGVVVGVLAFIRWRRHQPGWSWPNLILGIWLVISPFVFFVSGAAMWNNVITGIVISALALSNTYSRARPHVA
jgi:hypothetical protein